MPVKIDSGCKRIIEIEGFHFITGFYVVLHDGELDWIDLKEILDRAPDIFVEWCEERLKVNEESEPLTTPTDSLIEETLGSVVVTKVIEAFRSKEGGILYLLRTREKRKVLMSSATVKLTYTMLLAKFFSSKLGYSWKKETTKSI